MKLVYVAGPFRNKSQWGVYLNVHAAWCATVALWKLGVVPLCPHTQGINIEREIEDEQILAGMLEQLRRCDAVYVMGRSPGTEAEIAEAWRLNLPVFYNLDGVAHWVRTGKVSSF